MKHSSYVIPIFLGLTLLLAKESEPKLLQAYKSAINSYKKDPHNLKHAISLARIAFDAGNFKQAYDVTWLILQTEPQHLQALSLYADILIQYGYESRARNKLKLILEAHPNTQESKHAQKALDTLDRLHTSFQKLHKLDITAGIDTNPAFSSYSYDISSYITTIACKDTPENCDFNQRFSSFNPYISTSLEGNYIYDMGDTAGFFFKFGWMATSKNYIQDIDSGSFAYRFKIQPGYATQNMGTFQFSMEPGTTYNKLTPSTTTKSTHEYSTFRLIPQYRYTFESGSSLALGFEHDELDSHESFILDTFYYDHYFYNKNMFFAAYKTGPYNVKLSAGTHRADFYDYYNPYMLPYRDYDFSTITASYSFKNSAYRAFKVDALLQNRSYMDPLFFDNNITSSEQRSDTSIKLSIQMKTLKGFFKNSVLGYTLYANGSNYAPMDLMKHELTLSYPFKP